jgi:hypothetical protein
MVILEFERYDGDALVLALLDLGLVDGSGSYDSSQVLPRYELVIDGLG